MEAVTTSLSLKPENLASTERVIFFHALRVQLQVNCLNPLEWKWKTTDAGLEPVKTDLDTAPECKLFSKNSCGTRLCSCFRRGLQCLPACGDCRGESCENSMKVKDVENEEEFDGNIFVIFN